MSEPTLSTVSVLFTNNCGVSNFLSPGTALGWLVLEDVGPPSPSIDNCVGRGTIFPCSCSPSTYQLRVSFRNTCPTDMASALGSPLGIQEALCLMSSGEATPRVAKSVQVFELDEHMNVFAQQVYTDLLDGDTFTYESAATPGQVTKALQFAIQGSNTLGRN